MKTFEINQSSDNLRLDKWFKNEMPHITFGMLQKALRTGMVKVNNKKTPHDYRLQSGDNVGIANSLCEGESELKTKQSKPTGIASQEQLDEIKQWVIFQDDYLIALNKPAGIAAQGGSGINDCIDTRLDGLRLDGAERPKLVHRIDRDTSGVLLLGKTRAAAAELTETFRNKTLRKIYWAIVVGSPSEQIGTINLRLAKRGAKSGYEKMSVAVDQNGDEAITHFRLIAYNKKYNISWLECMPITGRTHQIRAHLQAIGCPIYGDGKYGGKAAFYERLELPNQLHLHARFLQLPNNRKYKFIAPISAHFKQSFKFLSWSESDDSSASLLDLF
jgi:23S rRNA pseudouridine955/2504/2580 synthase